MSEASSRDISRSRSNSSQSTDITEPSEIGIVRIKTTFQRWRPAYHLQAPSGWMNDPCAPHYDPVTDLYHVSYQSNQDLNNADWGDIVWRSATSSDLVTWTHHLEPSLIPDTCYDNKGVFTGCKIPSRDESLIYAYTSVSSLPIHHTLPHAVGSESLSMAKSFDGGKTWQKYADNPILPSEPIGLEVTGWRDPFVSTWPSMAVLLGLHPEDTLFGIISGGIRDVTPTTFLYSIDFNDLASWRYIGPLVDFGLNFRPSRWSGDLGKNWEVTNFLTLQDSMCPSISRDFLVMGTEGCLPSALNAEAAPIAGLSGPSRPLRGQLWMSGPLVKEQPSTSLTSSVAQMQYSFGGHLDHGCLYAANSFFDTKSSKHIVWGWITEEDLCDDLRHDQGWSGLLSLPREVYLQTIEKVICARTADLQSITSIETEADDHGTYTIRTLATQPVASVVDRLRQRAIVRTVRPNQSILQQRASHSLELTFDDVQTSAWELECSFSVSKDCREIGLQIVHTGGRSHIGFEYDESTLTDNIDFSQTTELFFTPSTNTFTIERPSLPSVNSDDFFNTFPEYAPHTLFTTADPSSKQGETEEHLDIHVWRDKSVLEVFINGRTAISTRLYAGEKTIGICFFADDMPEYATMNTLPDQSSSSAVISKSRLIGATLWDGISSEKDQD